MASAMMQTASSGSMGLSGARFSVAVQAAQQENTQLHAKVAILEASLRQALEQLQQLQEEEAALPVKVPCVGSALSVFGEADVKPSSRLPTPKLAYVVAPPPGLSLPATSLPLSPADSCRSAQVPPPGLGRRDRPRLLQLPLPRPADDSALPRTPTCSSQALTPSSSAGGLSDDGPREAPLRVLGGAGAAAGACVEWRLDCLQAKLKANCGFPLLSPMFSLGGVSDIRLMFIPGATWAARQAKASRKQLTRRRGSGGEGPRHGALRLKAASRGDRAPLRFHLVVGGRRQGPCYCDFAEHAVQGCDIDGDWLQQMDREAGCLHLRLEFF